MDQIKLEELANVCVSILNSYTEKVVKVLNRILIVPGV